MRARLELEEEFFFPYVQTQTGGGDGGAGFEESRQRPQWRELPTPSTSHVAFMSV